MKLLIAAVLALALGPLLGPMSALAQPEAPGTPDSHTERRLIDVPPRTPLYCEGGGHSIQPLIYGDFGDLVAAYDRLEHWPALVVSNGKRASGEDYYVLMFTAPDNDPRSPHEVVGYVITRHEDGYALRSVYDQPKDLPAQKSAGNDMCVFVLKMIIDSDPARAQAFRAEWGRKHPDSTGR